jgi:hypothetical protein
MPTYLRKFYFLKMQEFYKKEKAQYDKANKKSSARGPNINPKR